MKQEQFGRTKTVVATSALALVIAALVFGASSLAIGSRGTVSRGFDLTAGSPGFSITSNVYPSPACSGSTALLYPGVTRCTVLTVQNNLSVPVTVQNVSTTLSSSPPAGCPASDFSLPTFNGTLDVPAGGTATTPGQPISLIDTGTNQDACEGVTVNFVYTASAQFTDGTTVVVTSSPNPTSGQPVTLTATVTGANSGSDPSLPTGTVTFYSCPTSACTTKTVLGTGTIGAGGVATFTTSSLPAGVEYIEAVYGDSGTDYTGSTSSALTISVASPSTGSGSGNGASGPSSSSPGATAFTGADIAGMTVGGLALIGAGTFLVIAARRRRKSAGSES